jgi:hypothetical protein
VSGGFEKANSKIQILKLFLAFNTLYSISRGAKFTSKDTTLLQRIIIIFFIICDNWNRSWMRENGK